MRRRKYPPQSIMILFPNAKINLGLRVLRKRTDGYHDIESLMVPVGWHDILEIVPAQSGSGSFQIIGEDTLQLASDSDNLVMKALRAVEAYLCRKLPPLDIYLCKIIPTGAGLGGGSSDASFAIRGVNEVCALGMTDEEMAAIAAKVGADCPFFIYNRPMLAQGIGEILTPVEMPALNELTILIVKPNTEAVSTAAAYKGVAPAELPDGVCLSDFASYGASQWSTEKEMANDFEQSVFALRPAIAEVKKKLQQSGALYAAMSGSGASVFALYNDAKMAERASAAFAGCDIYIGALTSGAVAER